MTSETTYYLVTVDYTNSQGVNSRGFAWAVFKAVF